MDLKRIQESINWYLPSFDGKEPNKISVNKDEKYLASLISDFYYVEGLKRIWIENNFFNYKEKDFSEQDTERINRLDILDEIHNNCIFAKRFFLHVLLSIQKYANEAPEVNNDRRKILKNHLESCLVDCRNFLDSYFQKSEFDIGLLEGMLYHLIEEFNPVFRSKIFGVFLFFPFIKFKFTKKFYDFLFQGLNRDELYFLIRVWILFFEILSCRTLDDFDSFQQTLLSNSFGDDYSEELFFVDRNLGEYQKDCCMCMLQSNAYSYNSVMKDSRIRNLRNSLKANPDLRKQYTLEKKGRCYSCLWLNKSNHTYYALSGGGDIEIDYGNKLKSWIPQNRQYEQVILTDNVKFYPDENHFVLYGDSKQYMKISKSMKNEITHCFACCEIKLIAKIEEMNKINSTHHVFIKYHLCDYCEYALDAIKGKRYKVDVISPNKGKETKHYEIKFLKQMKPSEINFQN